MALRWNSTLDRLVASTTINLQERYFSAVQQLSRRTAPSFFNDPLSWALQWRWRVVNRRAVALIGELSIRYEGVLNQLLARSALQHSEYKEFFDRVWLIMAAKVMTISTPCEFAATLWAVAQKESKGLGAQALREKFLLRQFLEEMPVSDERAIILLLAFDKQAKAADVTTNTLRKLERSYKLLHDTLLRQGQQLSRYTSGVWSYERISSQMPEYEFILFDS
jgi:hypothetical protein